MKPIISGGARLIIDTLSRAGYRADIVGGSVRDALLGKEPDDYDITTNARPDEIKSVFSDFRTVDTGLKHGTVTVVLDDECYEVTTYRIDGEYTDGRHPDGVRFTNDIALDLKRRDFTVNAMAYSEKYGLTDPFCGEEDLRGKIIRAVGDPRERFSEDALRIMRALRFSSKLNFKIEDSLRMAIFDMRDRLSLVSVERIYTEWVKLLSGTGAYSVLTEYAEIILGIFPELTGLSLPRRDKFAAADARLRMLSVFAINSDKDGFVRAMRRMKTDNQTRTVGADALSLYGLFSSYDERAIRIAYTKYKIDTLSLACQLAELVSGADGRSKTLIDTLALNRTPSTLGELAVGGDDIMTLGVSGVGVGRILNALLLKCALGEARNEREELLSLAASLV